MLLGTRSGGQILKRSMTGAALLCTRSHLQNVLIESLPQDSLKLGCCVKRVEAQGVVLTNGEMIAGDLVVDAAGIRAISSCPTESHYSGYGGVLALSHGVDGPGLAGQAAEYWGWGQRFGVFELPHNRRYWFFMRSQRFDAAPPTIRECVQAAERWPEPVCQAVAATHGGALIPIAVYAKRPPDALSVNGVVKVGDAAHAMEPNLGQGACQALEDAVALMHAASNCSPNAICTAYERLRLDRVRMFVREATLARRGVHGPRLIQAILRTALKALPPALSERRIGQMQTMPDYSILVSTALENG